MQDIKEHIIHTIKYLKNYVPGFLYIGGKSFLVDTRWNTMNDFIQSYLQTLYFSESMYRA